MVTQPMGACDVRLTQPAWPPLPVCQRNARAQVTPAQPRIRMIQDTGLGLKRLSREMFPLQQIPSSGLKALLNTSGLIWPLSSLSSSLSRVWLLVTPWTAAHQASPSIINSWNLLKCLSIELVMPFNHLILCCPLVLPSVFPSIRVFSNESVLPIRWPKYWSFSFSISPSNEYSGLISFTIDLFDLLAVQGTLKSVLQYHSSKASIQLSLWSNSHIHTWLALTAKSRQSCLTLCDPIDSSPTGSSVPGILQARILESVAISFSSARKWKVKVKLHSCVQLFVTPSPAAYQAPPSMGFSRQEYWSGVPLPSPIWMADKHMERRSTSLATGEMKIKTMMRYHYIPTIIAKINFEKKKFWQECRETGSLTHCWWQSKLI